MSGFGQYLLRYASAIISIFPSATQELKYLARVIGSETKNAQEPLAYADLL
jgi:hypothetical protein